MKLNLAVLRHYLTKVSRDDKKLLDFINKWPSTDIDIKLWLRHFSKFYSIFGLVNGDFKHSVRLTLKHIYNLTEPEIENIVSQYIDDSGEVK